MVDRRELLVTTTQPRKATLVLPTIDTCDWRHVQDGAATCGLISSLTGETSQPLPVEACDACCRSFPPSARQLNPVIASLVYDAAKAIESRGGTPACSIERAVLLQKQSLQAMDIVHPAHLHTIPARMVEPCCWIGEPVDVPHQNTAIKSNPRQSKSENLYLCRHPKHEQTTLDECKVCRDWSRHQPVSRFLSLDELIPLRHHRCGTPVRNWAVGITTAPRRTSTIQQTLDSVALAGWENPRLFLDGTVHVPQRYQHLPISWRSESIGAWPSWYMALTELLLHLPDADAYVMLQDDVVMHDRENLREYLQRALWPGERPGIVSLFYNGAKAQFGWHRIRNDWPCSAQGLVLSPDVARSLICDQKLNRICLSASYGNHVPIPEVLADWVYRTGTEAWYTTPSVTQHIGNTSTIWMNAGIGSGRRASWYSGSVETEFSTSDSLSEFPEITFECNTSASAPYKKRVLDGYQNMRAFRAVICGLCRDVRPLLPRTAARIQKLGEMFADYRAVLFEDGSVDSTREFLADWSSQNTRIDILGDAFDRAPTSNTHIDRGIKMAELRNCYRRHLLEEYADFDFVVVVDTNLTGGWSYDGIAHTFGDLQWDAVGSYGLALDSDCDPRKLRFKHHDTQAFRTTTGQRSGIGPDHVHLDLKRGDFLMPVASSFGGMAVYRIECMRLAEYGGCDCEHVGFHQQLRQSGMTRIFLNPNQIVLH